MEPGDKVLIGSGKVPGKVVKVPPRSVGRKNKRVLVLTDTGTVEWVSESDLVPVQD